MFFLHFWLYDFSKIPHGGKKEYLAELKARRDFGRKIYAIVYVPKVILRLKILAVNKILYVKRKMNRRKLQRSWVEIRK